MSVTEESSGLGLAVRWVPELAQTGHWGPLGPPPCPRRKEGCEVRGVAQEGRRVPRTGWSSGVWERELVLSLGYTPGQTARAPLLDPGPQEAGGRLWRDEMRALGPFLVEEQGPPVSLHVSPSHVDRPGPGWTAEGGPPGRGGCPVVLLWVSCQVHQTSGRGKGKLFLERLESKLPRVPCARRLLVSEPASPGRPSQPDGAVGRGSRDWPGLPLKLSFKEILVAGV